MTKFLALFISSTIAVMASQHQAKKTQARRLAEKSLISSRGNWRKKVSSILPPHTNQIVSNGDRKLKLNLTQTTTPASGLSFEVGEQFLSIGSYNNLSTHHYIPPDPICAVSNTTLMSLVNDVIELRTKNGVILFQTNFSAFFSSLMIHNQSLLFDPKVVYDEYEDRFVLVVLNQFFISGNGPGDDNDDMRFRRHLRSAKSNNYQYFP